MEFGTCRSCKAQVWWAKTAATGTPMPLEPAPENGNVVIDGIGRAHAFRDHAAAVEAMETDESFPIGETYIAHRARCPDAEHHRRSRPASRPSKRKPSQPEEPLF